MTRKRLALASLLPLLASAAFCLAYLSPRNLAADAASKEAVKTKWEYKVVTVKSLPELLTDKEKAKIGLGLITGGPGTQIALNKLGAEGWELVLADKEKIFFDNETLLIFKRPR